MSEGGRKLLMTADAVGGVWTYALDLGAALARRGDRVTLAVLGPAPSDARRADAAARGVKLVDLGHPPDWLAGSAAAVGDGGAALAALLARHHAANLTGQLAVGGLLLWVRTRLQELEQRALDILARHAGMHVHSHSLAA